MKRKVQIPTFTICWGDQYVSTIKHNNQHSMYQKMLKNHGIVQSMQLKGTCLDNAMMENFFGLMKNEFLYVNDFKSIQEFETETKKYNLQYNNKRSVYY